MESSPGATQGDESSTPLAVAETRTPHKDDADRTSSTLTPTPAEAGNSFVDSSLAPSPTCVSSWSTSSEHQLGHGSQKDPSDRVFPIRSVISVEPAWSPSAEPDRSRKRVSLSEGSGMPQSAGASTRASPLVIPRSKPTPLNRRAATMTDTSLPSTISPAPSTPQSERLRQRRLNTQTGSLSSVQADADRYGTVAAMPLNVDSSSEEEESSPGADARSRAADESTGRQTPAESIPETLYSQRFKHVMTDEGHAVITGRDGTLQRCEDEPIHAPGAVQAFGLMIAIHEQEDGRFQVRYVSENSGKIIGYSPQALFKLGDFMDILTDEQADNLLDHIDFIRDEDADPAVNGPEVFSLSIKSPKQHRSVKLWCAIHLHSGNPELVICEFELDDDQTFPLRPADENILDSPADTLQSNPTSEELTESTEILSKPLRVLRTARKRRGEAGAMQVFDIMSQVQEQLANAPDLERFLKILVGIVKELTGFHRVMIYQFDSSFNGKVVTELVDFAQTKDLYKGLHFPASDIPKQARDLYKLNRVRILYDRDLESSRIVCRSVDDLETPLDMTHSYLRAMSPIHLKYLANMAVRSSMSISINAFGDLWGLIACHSYGPKGMRVSFPVRKMCRLVGDTASRNIERLSYASRLHARKLINTVPTDKNPSGYIIASSEDLLKLFDADFGMLSIREETKILGRIVHSQEALAMLEYLRLRKFTSVVQSNDLKMDFPNLRYPPGFSVIAGLLYVPLSAGGNDFIVFFRKGQIREVKWAGNPYEKFIRSGTQAYLEPRKSFKVWSETVVGKCREWSEEQIETAAVLCLVYGKFIEVWRQKEAALHSSRLTRLLLANSAHEVRTPLNAIINYLEIALEGSLDQETRDNLARSHSASKSLIYVINDLLDLTHTEKGQELIKDEIFDLIACVREGIEPFRNDASRKGVTYEFIEHPGLPRYVLGDQRRVRQAVSNVTANAVQHTSQGSVKIEMYVAEVKDRRVWVEIVVHDTGDGMTDAQLDALFRDLEQVSTDAGFDPFRIEENTEEYPEKDKTLGLGLAVVARILRNMDGQLRLKSEPGKGSRFVIQFPFDLPADDFTPTEQSPNHNSAASIASSGAVVAAGLAKPDDSEVTLVSRGHRSQSANSANRHTLSPQKSFDETRSISSQRSVASKDSGRSAMSDAERLIDAIQMPLALGEPESDAVALKRGGSRGGYYHAASGSTGSANDVPGSPVPSKGAETDVPARRKSSATNNQTDEKAAEAVGMQYITDSRVPIKPVRMPDEFQSQAEPSRPEGSSRIFELPNSDDGRSVESATLHVLIAEDDPINVKVLRKRLEKAGHKVTHALNGADCATVYKEKPGTYDVVLMDMQMPIADGLTSTKMIRTFESVGLAPERLSHVPIIAVSASLIEREKETYTTAGFDGWILKPIDFKRLETILLGTVDDGVRNSSLYVPGKWERGGWFSSRKHTAPASLNSAGGLGSKPTQPELAPAAVA